MCHTVLALMLSLITHAVALITNVFAVFASAHKLVPTLVWMSVFTMLVMAKKRFKNYKSHRNVQAAALDLAADLALG